MAVTGGARRRDVLRMGVLAGTGAAWLAVAPSASARRPPAAPGHDHGGDARVTDAAVAHASVTTAYRAVLLENLGPTAAARAYAHTVLAMYEAAVPGMPRHRSLAGAVQGLGPAVGTASSARGGSLDWSVAVSVAARDVLLAILPLQNPLTRPLVVDAHQAVLAQRRAAGAPQALLLASEQHGSAAASRVVGRAATDGYARASTRPYTPPSGKPWLWEPTPSNFRPADAPYAEDVRPFLLRSTDEVEADPPVTFSTKPGSGFYAQAMAVLEQSLANTDVERATASYWSDNPGFFVPPVGTPTGLPSGHWLRIASQAAEQRGLSLDDTLEVLVRVGLATNDAFLACWTTKYRTNLLRPVTYINRYIDPSWKSFVSSPPFPEHTSGHSVGSAAAAVVLTDMLGEGPFVDRSQAFLGLPDRTFASFEAAAREAAGSRLLGGIHFPHAIETGLVQGRRIGTLALRRLRTCR